MEKSELRRNALYLIKEWGTKHQSVSIFLQTWNKLKNENINIPDKFICPMTVVKRQRQKSKGPKQSSNLNKTLVHEARNLIYKIYKEMKLWKENDSEIKKYKLEIENLQRKILNEVLIGNKEKDIGLASNILKETPILMMKIQKGNDDAQQKLLDFCKTIKNSTKVASSKTKSACNVSICKGIKSQSRKLIRKQTIPETSPISDNCSDLKALSPTNYTNTSIDDLQFIKEETVELFKTNESKAKYQIIDLNGEVPIPNEDNRFIREEIVKIEKDNKNIIENKGEMEKNTGELLLRKNENILVKPKGKMNMLIDPKELKENPENMETNPNEVIVNNFKQHARTNVVQHSNDFLNGSKPDIRHYKTSPNKDQHISVSYIRNRISNSLTNDAYISSPCMIPPFEDSYPSYHEVEEIKKEPIENLNKILASLLEERTHLERYFIKSNNTYTQLACQYDALCQAYQASSMAQQNALIFAGKVLEDKKSELIKMKSNQIKKELISTKYIHENLNNIAMNLQEAINQLKELNPSFEKDLAVLNEEEAKLKDHLVKIKEDKIQIEKHHRVNSKEPNATVNDSKRQNSPKKEDGRTDSATQRNRIQEKAKSQPKKFKSNTKVTDNKKPDTEKNENDNGKLLNSTSKESTNNLHKPQLNKQTINEEHKKMINKDKKSSKKVKPRNDKEADETNINTENDNSFNPSKELTLNKMAEGKIGRAHV